MELIITTPNELSQVVTEAVNKAVKRIGNHEPVSLPDRIGIEEVSILTGYSKSALYKMTMDGGIPFSKPRGKLVFSRKEIISWLNENAMTQSDIQTQVSENLMRQVKRKAGF